MQESRMGQVLKKSAIEPTNDGHKSNTKSLDFIITSCIVLIFSLCPLFFTGFASRGIGFEKIILFYFLVLMGVVAWVTKGVVRGELEIKRTPLDWPILATLVFVFVSTLLSINFKDSMIGTYTGMSKSLMAIIVFSLFYYLVINNITAKKVKLIFWSVIISSSLLIIYSLAQILGFFVFPFEFTKAVSFNPIGSLSSLTMYLVIVLPLFVVGASQVKKFHPNLSDTSAIIIKVLLIMLGLASLVVLTLLNGFTFWPAALVGAVIILMFFLAKIIKIANNNLVIPLAFFILMIIFLVLGNFNIMELNLPVEVSLSRGASWNIAENSMKSNPIFGSGPSTFYYDFSKFKGQDFNSTILWNTRFEDASGIFFESLATIGILGTLSIIVGVLITLSICFLTLIKSKEEELSSIILGLFSSLITVIIFATLFSLNHALIMVSVMVAVFALASSILVYPEKFHSFKLSFRSSPKYALALSAIFLVVSAGVVILFTMGLKMYLADIYAQQALKVSDTDSRINKLNKAVSLFPYEDSYYMALSNFYMDLANKEASNSGADQTRIESNLALAIENGKKAVNLTPEKAANNEALALIYENASFYTRGALEWAENLYKKVMDLEPSNPVPHLRMALINMARSNAETDTAEKQYYINEAIKKYDEAIAKKNDLAAAFYGKAVAYEQLNNNGEAIEQLKKAVISDRSNIDYSFELGRLYFNRGVSQPNISQNASKELTEGEQEGEDLSVATDQPTGSAITRNDDLNMAEQIFASIYQQNPNHANALYSLALLYQKIGEDDKARLAVGELLKILSDQPSIEAVQKQFPGLY